MQPFKWTPDKDMIFNSGTGSQVLAGGNYNINGGSLFFDAHDDVLLLRSTTGLEWSGSNRVTEIKSGSLEVTFTKNIHYLISGHVNIGFNDIDASLSLIVIAHEQPAGKMTIFDFIGNEIKIGPSGRLDILFITENMGVSISGFELKGAAVLNVCTGDGQNNELYGDDSVYLHDKSRLLIDTHKLVTQSLSIKNSSSAIICTDIFQTDTETTIDISDSGYIYLGSRDSSTFVIPQRTGLFNFISEGAMAPTIALNGDAIAGAPINTGFGQQWLESNNIIYVDGMPAAKGVLKFDYASQDGIMLVSI